jgi:hypothetical protein
MWQEYFEQFIRPQLQDLAARHVSGRELTERLRDIATAYKIVSVRRQFQILTNAYKEPPLTVDPSAKD